MGEPATPTDAERAETLVLARQIVATSDGDERSPFERPVATAHVAPPMLRVFEKEGGMPMALPDFQRFMEWLEWVDEQSFRLAQDLVDTRTALERACSALRGSYTTTERDELAVRLLKLDFDAATEVP